MEPEHYAFEWALQQLRMGKKVTHRGWNGRGMYVVLQKGYPDGIPINENTASFVPWIASQTDLLSFDWDYVDVAKA